MSIRVTSVLFVLVLCAATASAAISMLLPDGIDRLANGNTVITDAGSPMSTNNARVIEIDSLSRLVWAYVRSDIPWAHSGCRLANGNTLITTSNGNRVAEVNPQGETVWEMASGLAYPNWACRLDDGNTLITDRDDNRVIEVDTARDILWSYTNLAHPHHATRLANGNTLVCNSDNNRIVEVAPNGSVVWQYATGLNWPRCAQRLPNGHTLITDSNRNRVIEVDSAGSITWTLNSGLSAPYMATRLGNGNTIVSTDTRVVEVNQAASVVWQYPPKASAIVVESLWVTNPTSGCSMYVHIHRPASAGPASRVPAAVLVPDLSVAGTAFDNNGLAFDIATEGFAVLHFDADGRGRSRHGSEDYDGFVQQDGLRACALLLASKPYVDSEKLGIYARGYGIVMATGMIARYDLPRVKFLMDFEGPSDRYQCCADSGGHVPVSPDSEAFWQEREAGRFIRHVAGAYLRIQTETDHTSRIPDNHHAVALVDSATSTACGGSGMCIWTRANDSTMNPANQVYSVADPPLWIPEVEQASIDCRELLYLHELADRDFTSAVSGSPSIVQRPSFSVSPNPCRGQVTVRLSSPLVFGHSQLVNLYDASGRLALSQPVRSSSFTLRTSSLHAGVYLMRMDSGAGAASAKLVVR